MASYSLSKHFSAFFSRLNPGASFVQTAASQHDSIRKLIEDPNGPTSVLAPVTFLQGSYRQQTAIYSINDVDIVVLCNLHYPGVPGGFGKTYGRDDIFRIIAAPLLSDGRYRNKVHYRPESMCIKVDLGIKVEILPVVFKQGISDSGAEPFVLYRPEKGTWEDGYARYHQQWLSIKNATDRTGGNFIPAIKAFKHIRSKYNLTAVSFHIECLLYHLDDANYTGGPADYLAQLFRTLAAYKPEDWYRARVMTPCGDRDIFTGDEWKFQDWRSFHELIVKCSAVAEQAVSAQTESHAIACWQAIFGNEWFPASVS